MTADGGRQWGLGAVAAKGGGGTARARHIDWNLGVVPPRWLPHKLYAAVISQFYHGERATVRLCRRLLAEVDDPPARRCLANQLTDEVRHAGIYRTYLERLGEMAPVDPALAAAIDRGFAWPGSHLGLIVAFHVVLEGEALRALGDLGTRLPCPPFRQINGHVTRDEARHVAFGRVYLRDGVAALDDDERTAVYLWVRELWTDAAAGMLERFAVPGFISRGRRHRWSERNWTRHRRALIDIGLVSPDQACLAEGRGRAGHAA